MDGIGSHFTTERVKTGHSRPTTARARPRPYRDFHARNSVVSYVTFLPLRAMDLHRDFPQAESSGVCLFVCLFSSHAVLIHRSGMTLNGFSPTWRPGPSYSWRRVPAAHRHPYRSTSRRASLLERRSGGAACCARVGTRPQVDETSETLDRASVHGRGRSTTDFGRCP